jgi:alkylation response protein AidB-like acyl-CoA dehydrogenase
MSQNNKHLEIAANVVEVAKEHAAAVDASGEFPKAAIDAFLKTALPGLLSATAVGGMGLGPRQAVEVVEQLAKVCASTAMIVTMHYAGSAVIEKYGDEPTRKAVAAGKHLSTLAFSERGSRSHFWAPCGTSERTPAGVTLNADKSFVTAASQATAYVWSSPAIGSDKPSTLWLVPRATKGLNVPERFHGLGLRGNDSAPVTARQVEVPESNRLGEEGGGFDIMLGTVLPMFNVMTAAVAAGLMDAATTATASHAAGSKLEHLGSALCDLPTIRSFVAQMRCKTDMARALLFDTISAMETQRPDAVLRVLQSKAAAGEAATEVLDLAMRVCGGAAFRRDVGVERLFRDARAGTIMAPTTDQLYDFIGKAVCGMDVF